jgi:hypothetical protein
MPDMQTPESPERLFEGFSYLRIDKPDVSLRDFFQQHHLLGNPVFTGLIKHGSIGPEIRVDEDVCAFLPCLAMQFPGGHP